MESFVNNTMLPVADSSLNDFNLQKQSVNLTKSSLKMFIVIHAKYCLNGLLQKQKKEKCI